MDETTPQQEVTQVKPEVETIAQRKARQELEYLEYQTTIKEPEVLFNDFRVTMAIACEERKQRRAK